MSTALLNMTIAYLTCLKLIAFCGDFMKTADASQNFIYGL